MRIALFNMDPHQKIIYSIIEKFVKGTKREREVISVLSESLGLKTREAISLAGAGGKTTLMFRLAKELFLAGKKVVTTTTTKILEPASGETVSLFINLDEEELKQFVHKHLDEYKHITIARERLESGKLKGVSSDLVNDLWSSNEIDYIIIETDGAAGRPVKAPREGEPVIPSSTTLVVAILGVDGVGMEVSEENVFQAERVSKLTGIPISGKMTDEGMAVLLTHPKGIFKGAPPSSRVIAFLNKVDIPNGVIKAKGIAQKIMERKHPQIERVVLGQLRIEPPVVEVIFPS
jgi:probable selenium-dependent hydroxylase accessory protein YqeC